jgi:hypothetical protein
VQTVTQGLAVAKVAGGEAVDPRGNLRLRAGIRQSREPIVEDIFSGTAEVVTDFDRVGIVTYKLQTCKGLIAEDGAPRQEDAALKVRRYIGSEETGREVRYIAEPGEKLE